MATNNAYIGSPDNPKTKAVISYITFIGWIIAYILYRGRKDEFTAFHIRQTLLIHIISFLLKVVYSFNIPPYSPLDILIIAIGLVLFILWLKGFLNAMNGIAKPLPIIGPPAQSLFRSL